MLIIDDNVWIANTGDSRACISSNNGELFESLTQDHKPSELPEKTRIIQAGG